MVARLNLKELTEGHRFCAKAAHYYGGHFIETSIGLVFQVRFWERGKVAMGSCSLLSS